MLVDMNTTSLVPKRNFITSDAMGKIYIEHNGKDFIVIDANKLKSTVLKINLSKELRGISTEGLQKALSVGYLAISKVGDDYAVRFNARIAGGGFILAGLASAVGYIGGGLMKVAGEVTGNVALTALGQSTLEATPVVANSLLQVPGL